MIGTAIAAVMDMLRAAVLAALVSAAGFVGAGDDAFLDTHLLVTWYGNPHSSQMGILGEQTGAARAAALRRQAEAFTAITPKRVVPAYHLVAVIAQPRPGADGKYRRRESASVIQSLLDEARAHGFHLILDIQPGRSTVASEVDALLPFLGEPDVHLALDPEFDMPEGQVPGQRIGSMPAAEINDAVERLDALIAARSLPRKVLIVHQFTLGMLPDKTRIAPGRFVELVLNMDGFGSQQLKRASYRAVMRQQPLDYAGIKLFYRQDRTLFTPADLMALQPAPSVVIYQ